MAEAEGKIMTKEHRKILRNHRVMLEENLQPLKLLSHLTNVLSAQDEDEVKAERTITDQVRCLLDLLPRRGDKAFEEFVMAVSKTQRFLAVPLAQEAGIELPDSKDGSNGHCMRPEHKELLRSNKEVLKEIKLDHVIRLMAVVFDKEDIENINSEYKNTSKLDSFLDILGRKEDKAFHHFVEILRITDPSIAKFLVKEKEESSPSDEKGLPNPTQIVKPEDDTEISEVKHKLTSFCQKTNENNEWQRVAQEFQVQLTGAFGNPSNPTLSVLEQIPKIKVGELKQALNRLQMAANKDCLVNDLARQTDTTDSPEANPVNSIVQRTQNLSIDEYKPPKRAETFSDLSEEIQKQLMTQIQVEKNGLGYDMAIPPEQERQKYRIRDLTRLLRENGMKNTIIWMKENLQKGVTGPQFDENKNVRDLPYSHRSKLTIELCANNDNWKKLACHLGLSNVEISYFDNTRFKNPADEVLRHWETKRNTTIGDLYDILVALDMPVIADSAL